jgi:hypothetical protein
MGRWLGGLGRLRAAGTAYGVVVPLGPGFGPLDESFRRAAAGERALRFPGPPSPGELGAVSIAATLQGVPIPRQERARGDELGVTVAGEPKPSELLEAITRRPHSSMPAAQRRRCGRAPSTTAPARVGLAWQSVGPSMRRCTMPPQPAAMV